MSHDIPQTSLPQFLVSVLEAALEAEMQSHLKIPDPAHRSRNNSRNGFRSKLLRTDLGNITIAMPRDRLGTYDPASIRKRQRSFRRGAELLVLFLEEQVVPADAEQAVALIYPHDAPEAVRLAVGAAMLDAAEHFRSSVPWVPTRVGAQPLTAVYSAR